MRRHAECDNIVLLAENLEVDRVVALMAVKDKEAISGSASRSGVLFKVLNPF